jgi:hypothetical protein
VASNGWLTKTRLNTTLSYLPVPTLDKLRCAMHCWLGIETQKDLLKCEACNICLRVKSYQWFHTTIDLVRMKDKLCEFYGNKEKEKKTAMDCWNEIHSTITTKEKGTSRKQIEEVMEGTSKYHHLEGRSIWKQSSLSIKNK